MKIKILKPGILVGEFVVNEYDIHLPHLRFNIKNKGFYNTDDCVITELPESFCVKRCDDGIKWGKYIDWLNKTYNTNLYGRLLNFDNPSDYPYYGIIDNEGQGIKIPFGTEIHIDDMIKHIDYMERHIKGGEQFSKESQLIAKMDKISLLDYAKEHYPIGTKYIPVGESKKTGKISTSNIEPRLWGGVHIECGEGFIYHNGRWAEIIKEETNMNTQTLSRQGLKEIHSVACSTWKILLEQYGSRNPLEDYIELSQEEVNNMFNACTKEQLPIVSKYLKQDDGSVYLTNIKTDSDSNSIWLGDNCLIAPRTYDEYGGKAFCLNDAYKWEIKTDDYNQLCLIPTKKK